MRCKTKNELVILADLLVEKYEIEKALNSNEFLEYALHEATKNYIAINKQTLVKYEDDLKRMCRSRITEVKDVLEEDKFDQFLQTANEPKRKLVMTINYYDDGTYEKVRPQKEVEVMEVRIPEYTMFAEGEDGYIVLKGVYKGKLVSEIDEINWPGCARGWAMDLLKRDKNFTDDDRRVFQKIISGAL